MSRTGKYVETEGRLVVDSGGAGGGKGNKEWLLERHRISFLDNENVLELDGGIRLHNFVKYTKNHWI